MDVAMLHHVGSGGRPSPLLLSAAQDGSVCAWSTSTGQCVQRLHAHDHWVMALALGRRADASRDGLLLSGGYDGTVRAWVCPADDLAAGGGGWALCHTLEGHTDGVMSLELSRSRRLGFSGSNDGTVRLWLLADGTCAAVLSGHADGVSAMGWHLASGCLATGSEDGRVMLWDTSELDVPAGVEPGLLHAAARAARAAAAIAAASGEELVKDVVAAAAAPQARLVYSIDLKHANGEGAEVCCIRPSADGTALFCGLDDGRVALLSDVDGPAEEY